VSWALLVALLALFFTVASFWWLNARRGSLQVGEPGAYAFANKPRLRLPTAFYNTGARALIVTDLRLLLVEDAAQPPLAGSPPRRSSVPRGRTSAISPHPLPFPDAAHASW
jgi:hypothetical protein